MKFTREELNLLTKEQLIDIILAMQGDFEARIAKLEAQLAKHSGNSSKPPSSDGLRKPKSLREKGQRATGGQTGHKGETLKMVDTPTHIEPHTLSQCPECKGDLHTVEAVDVECRQVFDIPPVQLEVTEHRGEVKVCPHCHARVKANFPPEAAQAVQYGPRLGALAVYLNAYQMLPLQRTCELLGTLCGQCPSEAWVVQVTHTAQANIQASLAAIRAKLQQADVLHSDESGLRVEGKLNWVHVVSNADLTYYTVHRKRGQDGMDAAGVLPHFTGTLVHDHWRAYFSYNQARHALCNAHHLRELRFIHEQYHQDWAQQMSQLLGEANCEVASCPDRTALPADRLQHYQQRYTVLLEQGLNANLPDASPSPPRRGRPRQSPAKNLLDRLSQYRDAVLAFLHDCRVPFDNNLAERDIRMVKLKQKISGTFRSWLGAQAFCDLRSYISSARKQGHAALEVIHAALQGCAFIPT